MLASRIVRTCALAVLVMLAAGNAIVAQGYHQRARDAADAARRLFTEWYGVLESPEITIRPRSLSPARSRTLESAVVAAVARQFWPAPADRSHAWFADGLVEYSRARAMEALFPDGRAYEHRFFGGFIPYVARSVIVSHDLHETNRAALALRTLERHLGWPTLQPVLAGFAAAWRAGDARPADFAELASRATGRDLSWFFDHAFDPTVVFDFGIHQLVTEPIEGGRYVTTVVVRRHGEASFPGSAKQPEGRFRVPGALDLTVNFADGQAVQERLDGRDEELSFTYESRSPAVSAAIDPDRVVWLDVKRANNSRTVDVAQKAAALWAMRWLVWLEDLMLTYSFFV